jgi:hypothetical protein
MNIWHAVYNVLNNNIDETFKVSNDPVLVGWNQALELREIFNQITATSSCPTPVALL